MWVTVEACELLRCQIPHLLSVLGWDVKISAHAQVPERYTAVLFNTFWGYTASFDKRVKWWEIVEGMGKDLNTWKTMHRTQRQEYSLDSVRVSYTIKKCR